MKAEDFSCSECKKKLLELNGNLFCHECAENRAAIEDNIIIFIEGERGYELFDKITHSKLIDLYKDYSYDKFRDCLGKINLFEMDLPNKKVGIAKKLWWEKYLGKIEGKDVLEVGCGVNYIVPYWLELGNEVTAIDLCKESVLFLNNILDKVGSDKSRLNLIVADAGKIIINKKYDIININNVLHHIKDKEAVLSSLKTCLKDEGKLLIVEPNYYYPFRWIIETDVFGRLNFLRRYFINNACIEEDEKGIVFKDLKKILKEIGYSKNVNFKDENYIGYSLTHFIDKNKLVPKILHYIDRYILSSLLPSFLAPFEYLILTKY